MLLVLGVGTRALVVRDGGKGRTIIAYSAKIIKPMAISAAVRLDLESVEKGFRANSEMILSNQTDVVAGNRHSRPRKRSPPDYAGVALEQVYPESGRHVAANEETFVEIRRAKRKKHVQWSPTNNRRWKVLCGGEDECSAIPVEVRVLREQLPWKNRWAILF